MVYNKYWSEYPAQKPVESGYYICHHVMDGKRTKAIWWDSNTQNWIGWRYHQEIPIVLEFVLSTKNEYYALCTMEASCRPELWNTNAD